ncbi:biotin-protein ligase [Plakobranchus ocellatus]|uniref:Biotin-protein ligase n=1 Tax=Plakobranchus ocellatus TaxID=259542 RepID=A0AAV4C6M6_9GAST|nr:biotin-protein ligase [Plakobranchus ocellatus]
MMARSSVLVYRGTGASETGCFHLLNSLRSSLDSSSHDVQFVSPEGIIKDFQLQNAAMVAFGGGYTSGFETALGHTGINNLRDYVLGGGSYLGFGAGGYFGCDFIEFDKGGPLEKFSERDLRFYPGTGIGPVYQGFKYNTNQGVNAAPVTFHGTGLSSLSFYAFIDGGGMFKLRDTVKPDSSVTHTECLAQYDELSGKPGAVVRTLVGQGRAVLSGVHLEYDAISIVDSDPSLEQFRKHFEDSVESQQLAFNALLKLLNLHVVNK